MHHLVCGVVTAPPLTTHKPPAGSPGAAKNQVMCLGAKYCVGENL